MNKCLNPACGKPITLMIFRNEDFCSTLCSKVLKGEITTTQWEQRKNEAIQEN